MSNLKNTSVLLLSGMAAALLLVGAAPLARGQTALNNGVKELPKNTTVKPSGDVAHKPAQLTKPALPSRLKKVLVSQPAGQSTTVPSSTTISSTTPKGKTIQTTLKAAKSIDKNKTQRKAKKPKKRIAYKRSGICRDLDRVARRYKLPPLFFARLIWQESGFNPYAVSPAGAEGIAQFMPTTAQIWGLEDPFEPGQALLKSAQYLSWLHKKLGNLGLAAAGYNAGSERVKRWLAGTTFMPRETRNYVYAITGHTVEEWSQGNIQFVGIKVRGRMSATACKQLAIALRGERPHLVKASYSRAGKVRLGKSRRGKRKSGQRGKSRRTYIRRRLPRMPWGVQLAGSFSRAQAMKQFRSVKRKYGRIIGSKRIVLKSSRQQGRGRRIFHRVRVGAKTRVAAVSICNRLKSAGGYCVVLKN